MLKVVVVVVSFVFMTRQQCGGAFLSVFVVLVNEAVHDLWNSDRALVGRLEPNAETNGLYRPIRHCSVVSHGDW